MDDLFFLLNHSLTNFKTKKHLMESTNCKYSKGFDPFMFGLTPLDFFFFLSSVVGGLRGLSTLLFRSYENQRLKRNLMTSLSSSKKKNVILDSKS